MQEPTSNQHFNAKKQRLPEHCSAYDKGIMHTCGRVVVLKLSPDIAGALAGSCCLPLTLLAALDPA